MLKHRKDYKKLVRSVNQRAFDDRTSVLVRDFGEFFDEFPEIETIPMGGEFSTWFIAKHRNLKAEDASVFRTMFQQVAAEPAEGVKACLTKNLLESNLAVLVADIVDRYSRGEEIEAAKLIRKCVDEFDADVQRKVTIPFVDIGDNLFSNAVNNLGLHWRNEALQWVTRKLQPGDFGLIAARPDAGKTSFVASEITAMAAQLNECFGPEQRTVLWFNNEGPGKRIQERIVQAALGLPQSKIIAMQRDNSLWPAYAEAVGGDMFRIRVLDVHGYKSWQIEEIIKQVSPALVVFDMIDNIKFDGEVLNGGQRTDQILEGMYQWARELCVKYNLIGLATSQISADAEGVPYPPLAALKDSKTGKQGAADFIITLGQKLGPAFESVRFIGMTKNKLHVENRPRFPHAEYIFEATEGRFYAAEDSRYVSTDAGPGDDNDDQLQTESEPVRSSELGSVGGDQAPERSSELRQDGGTGTHQGVASEDPLAEFT